MYLKLFKIFAILLFVVFIWAAYTALDWPPPVRQFPLLIAVPAVLLSLTVIIKDMAHLQATKRARSPRSSAAPRR